MALGALIVDSTANGLWWKVQWARFVGRRPGNWWVANSVRSVSQSTSHSLPQLAAQNCYFRLAGWLAPLSRIHTCKVDFGFELSARKGGRGRRTGPPHFLSALQAFDRGSDARFASPTAPKNSPSGSLGNFWRCVGCVAALTACENVCRQADRWVQ